MSLTRVFNRWSSYGVNGCGQADTLITPHDHYLHLGKTPRERQQAYRALFRAHIEPQTLSAIRHATNGNYVLGSHRFQEEIETMLKRRVTPGKKGRPEKVKD